MAVDIFNLLNQNVDLKSGKASLPSASHDVDALLNFATGGRDISKMLEQSNKEKERSIKNLRDITEWQQKQIEAQEKERIKQLTEYSKEVKSARKTATTIDEMHADDKQTIPLFKDSEEFKSSQYQILPYAKKAEVYSNYVNNVTNAITKEYSKLDPALLDEHLAELNKNDAPVKPEGEFWKNTGAMAEKVAANILNMPSKVMEGAGVKSFEDTLEDNLNSYKADPAKYERDKAIIESTPLSARKNLDPNMVAAVGAYPKATGSNKPVRETVKDLTKDNWFNTVERDEHFGQEQQLKHNYKQMEREAQDRGFVRKGVDALTDILTDPSDAANAISFLGEMMAGGSATKGIQLGGLAAKALSKAPRLIEKYGAAVLESVPINGVLSLAGAGKDKEMIRKDVEDNYTVDQLKQNAPKIWAEVAKEHPNTPDEELKYLVAKKFGEQAGKVSLITNFTAGVMLPGNFKGGLTHREAAKSATKYLNDKLVASGFIANRFADIINAAAPTIATNLVEQQYNPNVSLAQGVPESIAIGLGIAGVSKLHEIKPMDAIKERIKNDEPQGIKESAPETSGSEDAKETPRSENVKETPRVEEVAAPETSDTVAPTKKEAVADAEIRAFDKPMGEELYKNSDFGLELIPKAPLKVEEIATPRRDDAIAPDTKASDIKTPSLKEASIFEPKDSSMAKAIDDLYEYTGIKRPTEVTGVNKSGYNAQTHTIGFETNADPRTIIHEHIHAITAKGLENIESLAKDASNVTTDGISYRGIKNLSDGVLKQVNRVLRSDGLNPVANIHELIANRNDAPVFEKLSKVPVNKAELSELATRTLGDLSKEAPSTRNTILNVIKSISVKAINSLSKKGDAPNLAEVVDHLFATAVNETPKSENVIYEAKVEHNQIHVAVDDTGAPIAKEPFIANAESKYAKQSVKEDAESIIPWTDNLSEEVRQALGEEVPTDLYYDSPINKKASKLDLDDSDLDMERATKQLKDEIAAHEKSITKFLNPNNWVDTEVIKRQFDKSHIDPQVREQFVMELMTMSNKSASYLEKFRESGANIVKAKREVFDFASANGIKDIDDIKLDRLTSDYLISTPEFLDITYNRGVNNYKKDLQFYHGEYTKLGNTIAMVNDVMNINNVPEVVAKVAKEHKDLDLSKVKNKKDLAKVLNNQKAVIEKAFATVNAMYEQFKEYHNPDMNVKSEYLPAGLTKAQGAELRELTYERLGAKTAEQRAKIDSLMQNISKEIKKTNGVNLLNSVVNGRLSAEQGAFLAMPDTYENGKETTPEHQVKSREALTQSLKELVEVNEKVKQGSGESVKLESMMNELSKQLESEYLPMYGDSDPLTDQAALLDLRNRRGGVTAIIDKRLKGRATPPKNVFEPYLANLKRSAKYASTRNIIDQMVSMYSDHKDSPIGRIEGLAKSNLEKLANGGVIVREGESNVLYYFKDAVARDAFSNLVGEFRVPSSTVTTMIANGGSRLARWFTVANPKFAVFAMFRNLMENTVNIAGRVHKIYMPDGSEANYSKIARDSMKEMFSFKTTTEAKAIFMHNLTGDKVPENNTLYKYSLEMMQVGGGLSEGKHSFLTSTDLSRATERWDKLIGSEKKGLLKKLVAKDKRLSALVDNIPAAAMVAKGSQSINHFLETLMHTSDQIQMACTYKAMRDNGVLPESANFAVRQYNNVSKKSAMVKASRASNYYAFVQPVLASGLYSWRLIRTRDGRINLPGLGVLAGWVAMGAAAQAIGNQLFGEDQDVFDDKSINVAGTKIPLPYGGANLAWNVGRHITKAAAGQESLDSAGLRILQEGFLDNFSLINAPSFTKEDASTEDRLKAMAGKAAPIIFQPIVEWMTNQNSFGSTIEYGKEKNYEDEPYYKQAGESKVETPYKNMSHALYEFAGIDISPKVIKHFMTGYIGGQGKIAKDIYVGLSNAADSGETKDYLLAFKGVAPYPIEMKQSRAEASSDYYNVYNKVLDKAKAINAKYSGLAIPPYSASERAVLTAADRYGRDFIKVKSDKKRLMKMSWEDRKAADLRTDDLRKVRFNLATEKLKKILDN